MKVKLAVVSLRAEDVSSTIHFYKDVLGLHLLSHHDDRPHFDLGNCYLVILKGRATPAQDLAQTRFPIIALAVDDLDTAIERLSAHHVDFPWGVEEDADSRWVMFHDAAGNLIELVQFRRKS